MDRWTFGGTRSGRPCQRADTAEHESGAVRGEKKLLEIQFNILKNYQRKQDEQIDRLSKARAAEQAKNRAVAEKYDKLLQDYNALVASKKDLEGRLEKEHKHVLDDHRKHDEWVKADAIHDAEAQQLYETTKSQLLSSQAEEKRLSGIVAALGSEINQLKTQIGSLQHEKADIEDKAQSLEHGKEELQHQLANFKDENKDLAASNADKDKQITNLDETQKGLVQNLHACESQIAAKKAEIARAQADLADAERKLEAIREDGGWIKPTAVSKN